MISFNEKSKVFNLKTDNTSYIFSILCDRYLVHHHYGKRIDDDQNIESLIRQFEPAAFASEEMGIDMRLHTDVLEQEYSFYGSCDLRTPAFHAKYADGTFVTKAFYRSHKIYNGKKALKGLPATYVECDDEAQTLEIELYDELKDMSIFLVYSVFEKYDAITRSVRVENHSNENIDLHSVLSFSIDFPQNDYDFVHLYGAWARERTIERRPLIHGNINIDSKRGASGHYHNPFFAICDRNSDEYVGNVYGFSLVYSGNFIAGVECDTTNLARVYMGLNPFNFKWTLKSGEDFVTPEVVMVYSDSGINKMSQCFHNLFRERLCRGIYRDAVRPVIANNWEGTMFDFNEEKILNIASKAKEIGVDLFVLDDGWFGKRDADNSSLGDWYADKRKLPNGVEGLSKKIKDMGMQFGLWYEPEMISPDSDLYRAHPDWCLHTKGRKPSLGRNQLVLDFTRKDVREYIVNVVSDMLTKAEINYVKWDMNRNMTEAGSVLLPYDCQEEIYHRYILGLYEVMETLIQRHPTVLWEGCSGGGGRFDAGMLYYFPQSWCSDNTDPIDRIFIQYGTSLCYPSISMGAHVTSTPKENNRITSLKTRGAVAMTGQFGYETDLTQYSDIELSEMAKQIVFYKKYREVIQFGELYRLKSPYSMNDCALEYVSKDGNTVMIFYFTIHHSYRQASSRLCIKGLDNKAKYQLVESDTIYSGELLMNAGMLVQNKQDFDADIYIFEKQVDKD